MLLALHSASCSSDLVNLNMPHRHYSKGKVIFTPLDYNLGHYRKCSKVDSNLMIVLGPV